MTLPKITLDRIFENAFNCTSKLKEEKRGASYCLGFQAGYEAGATAEAQRAQKLVEALEQILKQHTYYDVIELAVNALQQWNAGKDIAFKGSVITEPATGIALDCISPEARELLDTIMEQWEEHRKNLVEVAGYKEEPTHYGFAYWLVRWSGLIQPAAKPATHPCPHCGKELSRDRNLCCRECGKEVSNELP